MSNHARRRLIKDLEKLEKEAPPGLFAVPLSSNMMHVHAIIQGPIDTDWEAGVFHLTITFSHDYPLKPPKVRLLTDVFHPNVYPDGRLCLDILQKQWSTGYDLTAILTSIQSLLSDPNVESPARAEAAELYQYNLTRYRKNVMVKCTSVW